MCLFEHTNRVDVSVSTRWPHGNHTQKKQQCTKNHLKNWIFLISFVLVYNFDDAEWCSLQLLLLLLLLLLMLRESFVCVSSKQNKSRFWMRKWYWHWLTLRCFCYCCDILDDLCVFALFSCIFWKTSHIYFVALGLCCIFIFVFVCVCNLDFEVILWTHINTSHSKKKQKKDTYSNICISSPPFAPYAARFHCFHSAQK